MKNSLLLFVFFVVHLGYSQNLLQILEQQQVDTTAVTLTFKGTRIGLGHSTETRSKNTFEFSIGQRYWNTGDQQSSGFLVDRASTTFALDYAFNDNFTAGASLTTLIGTSNLYGKYRLKRQRNGEGFSVGLTFVQTLTYKFEMVDPVSLRDSFTDQLGYTSQLLISHKFDPKFSAQLSPTFIHRGSNRFQEDPDSHAALGVSGRYKLSPHFELFSEYFYVINPVKSIETFDAFSIGGNWELGDLLLQFMFTNGRSFSEDLFITNARQQFNIRNQNLTFGFRGTYTFQL